MLETFFDIRKMVNFATKKIMAHNLLFEKDKLAGKKKSSSPYNFSFSVIYATGPCLFDDAHIRPSPPLHSTLDSALIQVTQKQGRWNDPQLNKLTAQLENVQSQDMPKSA